jgi:hypothetical protein
MRDGSTKRPSWLLEPNLADMKLGFSPTRFYWLIPEEVRPVR